jgi:hypothetical protein
MSTTFVVADHQNCESNFTEIRLIVRNLHFNWRSSSIKNILMGMASLPGVPFVWKSVNTQKSLVEVYSRATFATIAVRLV